MSLATTDYEGRPRRGRDRQRWLHRAATDRWYDTRSDLDLQVEWWDRPFNYSEVNNAGAALGNGEKVLVFFNDDRHPHRPAGWLTELVGYAAARGRRGRGLRSSTRRADPVHGGAAVGMHGFADHLFAGMEPGSNSLVGPTGWYRNLLALHRCASPFVVTASTNSAGSTSASSSAAATSPISTPC